MNIPIFDRVFSFFGEQRQWEKALLMLRQYFLENPVAIAGVALAVLTLIVSLFTKKMAAKRRADWTCVRFYYYALLLVLVFSRYWQGDVRGIRAFGLSYYLTEDAFHEASVLITLVNALVFVPFGCLLRKAADGWNYLQMLLVAFLLGTLVEVLQYIFARGNSALQDILAYVLGTLVGMVLMGIKMFLFKPSARKGLNA